MAVQSAYQEEQERLSRTLVEIDHQLEAIGPRYFGDDYTEQVLDAHREERRRKLSTLSSEPYFGRIDFQEQGRHEPDPYYIGKMGLEHRDTGQPYILDWRAPAASIFYAFTGGDDAVCYDSPGGDVSGTVHLKRSMAIHRRILQRVVDSYVRGGENLNVTDEFLLYRLGENKDNRLRDIVSTIQAEQDRIIRAPRNTVLIIQGVAGSGKTTVALHRIAFLLYQYQDQLHADRMIIFAPNAMFLDYISGVLPELGVGNIRQTTFTDWALELLEKEVRLTNEADNLKRWFAVGSKRPRIHDGVPGRFKGSLHFKAWLDRCIDRFEAAYIPAVDFIPWQGKTLQASVVKEWFFGEYRHYPIGQRRQRLVGRIKRWLDMELGALPASLKKERSKTAKQRLNTYLKKLPDHTPVTFYKALFGLSGTPDWLDSGLSAELPEAIVQWTSNRLKKNFADVEDLAPMLWISLRFFGMSGQLFDHVVLDEAQDISPFQIALLREHMREPSFTILGDLAQGIHAYRGVLDWSELMAPFSQEQVSFHQLQQSYRSTTEIIEFANRIIAHGGEGLTAAKPVFRSGDPVELVPLTDVSGTFDYVLRWLDKSREAGAASMAVLCRTEKESIRLHQLLTEKGVEAALISAGEQHYRGGVSVLPVYLSKGLEFDAVLITDVDAEQYGCNSQDAKLLYVGCTRALHSLTLTWSGQESPLVREQVAEK